MDRVPLAELCAATSLFIDLGTGQPPEHALRTCLVAMRLADELGLGAEVGPDLYYVALLRFLGCTADSHEVAAMVGGDDVTFLADMAPVTMGPSSRETARFVGSVGRDETLPRRLRLVARGLADPGGKVRLLGAHCEVAVRLAGQMGLPVGVTDALAAGFARWDGKGVPRGVAGEEIPTATAIAIVAHDIELWGRRSDSEAAAMLRTRRGRAHAPAVVDAALAAGVDRLRSCEPAELWERIVALEPEPRRRVAGVELEGALAALGHFADLKAPPFAGHSRRVAQLAAAGGDGRGLTPAEVTTLRLAALVHDLGVVSVPSGVWMARRRLSVAEDEQVRLHPLWSERILGRCTGLGEVARLAGAHHERADGSGYPHGATLGGPTPGAGVLACAEWFDEHTTERPHRPVLDFGAAADELARQAGDGRFDRRDVDAVLDAVGAAIRAPLVERPAGLTEREIDVIRLLARGDTNRRIAGTLGISPKTVGTHVEHIYTKTGVTSRAAATLFAVENDLLGV